MTMDYEPEHAALFQIEGPDKDGYVWVRSPEDRESWSRSLGPKDKVVAVMSQWLARVEAEEHPWLVDL